MMKNPSEARKEILARLTDAERETIMYNFQHLEEYGQLDGGLLRRVAEELQEAYLPSKVDISNVVYDVANDCHRYFAWKWVKEFGKT